jgi:predicted Zn finger-like uncharacterized protein
MSLLTQCPACQTYYRVVPDQLRISDGWVKCGQCSDIFNASAHLIEIDTNSDLSGGVAPPDSPPAATVQAINQPEDGAPTHGADSQHENSEGAETKQAEQTAPLASQVQSSFETMNGNGTASDAARAEPFWVAQDLEADARPDVLPQLKFPDDGPVVEPVIAAETQRVRWDDALPSSDEATAPVQETIAADETVTFLRNDGVPPIWQKPLVRGGLMMLVIGLVLLLAGQWVYRERDKLAATHPDLKSTLQGACAWLNCVVQPVRQIDALTIDSVAFNKLDKDAFKLSFLVKNSSELPLAYPAVELVLTDAEDQPAYRRVLLSSELGARTTELAAGAEWPVTVTLRVDAPTVTPRVFGYRLLVFYP